MNRSISICPKKAKLTRNKHSIPPLKKLQDEAKADDPASQKVIAISYTELLTIICNVHVTYVASSVNVDL